MIDVCIAISFALALMWPALVNNGALLFYDTEGYVSKGAVAWGIVADLFGGSTTQNSGGAHPLDSPESVSIVRSIAYSIFSWPLFSVLPRGLGLVAAQALIAALIAVAFLDRQGRPQVRALILICVAALTPLPVVVSYAMPDVFAGLAIVLACVIVQRAERLDLLQAVVLAVVGGGFASFHLSHLPLSAALGLAGLAALAANGSLRWPAAVALLAPPVLAALVNLLGSAVAFQEPSVAPKRLPVALARSLVDGPARRHVEEACEKNPTTYSLCPIIGTLPADVGGILFGADGFRALGGEDVYTRLRKEEPIILARAMAAEPLAQFAAFALNSAEQLRTFGLSDVGWSRLQTTPEGDWSVDLGLDRDRTAWRAIEFVHAAVVIAAVGILLFFVTRDKLSAGHAERAMAFVVIIGLSANAAICGGLSAPADRYGARVIWVLPLLAALMAMRRASIRRRSPTHGVPNAMGDERK